VITKCGWQAHVLNPDAPVAGVAQGISDDPQGARREVPQFYRRLGLSGFFGDADVATGPQPPEADARKFHPRFPPAT